MMFEISVVSQSNGHCDHCNRKCTKQYENDNHILLHCFEDRNMQFYCCIRILVDGKYILTPVTSKGIVVYVKLPT